MSLRFNLIVFRAKAVLCIALTLFLQFGLAGCGTNIFSGPGAGRFQVPLNSGSPILDVLEGSPFQDAIAINILPASQEFQFVFPDTIRKLSGKYAYVDSAFTITQFSFTHRGRTADVTMDGAKRIQSIRTSEGYHWSSSDSDARVTYPPNIEGADAYLQANPDVTNMALTMDAQAGISNGAGTLPAPQTPGAPQPPKTGNPNAQENSGNALAAVLAVIASIWAPLVGILSPLLGIFGVAAMIQNTLVTRFDGNWTAANADSNLRLTISGGKITRIVDQSSSQELKVLDTRLDRIDGNKVTWVVDAQLLGQTTSVNFTFDMQENANGSLTGTLTALGSNFARVPVTMTRS